MRVRNVIVAMAVVSGLLHSPAAASTDGFGYAVLATSNRPVNIVAYVYLYDDGTTLAVSGFGYNFIPSETQVSYAVGRNSTATGPRACQSDGSMSASQELLGQWVPYPDYPQFRTLQIGTTTAIGPVQQTTTITKKDSFYVDIDQIGFISMRRTEWIDQQVGTLQACMPLTRLS